MCADHRLVIRLSALPDVIGIKRTAISELIQRGDFPKPITLGGKSKGILVSELEAWLESRKAERDAPDRS